MHQQLRIIVLLALGLELLLQLKQLAAHTKPQLPPMTVLTGVVKLPWVPNLSVGCGLSGGATVLSGVAYGVVSGVSIDGSTLNIAQPCSSTSCKDPGNGKIISGYYPNWARYGKNFR